MNISDKKKGMAKKVQGGHVYTGKAAKNFLMKLAVREGLPGKTEKEYDAHMDKFKKRQYDWLDRVTHFHDKRGY